MGRVKSNLAQVGQIQSGVDKRLHLTGLDMPLHSVTTRRPALLDEAPLFRPLPDDKIRDHFWLNAALSASSPWSRSRSALSSCFERRPHVRLHRCLESRSRILLRNRSVPPQCREE